MRPLGPQQNGAQGKMLQLLLLVSGPGDDGKFSTLPAAATELNSLKSSHYLVKANYTFQPILYDSLLLF